MTCRACHAPECDHSDPVYAGLVPATNAPRDREGRAPGAGDPFHAVSNSAGGAHDHVC